jgi:hypothetical protein
MGKRTSTVLTQRHRSNNLNATIRQVGEPDRAANTLSPGSQGYLSADAMFLDCRRWVRNESMDARSRLLSPENRANQVIG